MPPVKYFENMDMTAGTGESEIVIKGIGGINGVPIFVDGEQRMILKYDKIGTVIVPDGRHSITVNMKSTKANEITVDAARSRIVIQVKFDSELYRYVLSKYAVISLDAYKSKGMEDAVKRACLTMINGLPNSSKIAVVYITAKGAGVASLILDEVEFHLVSTERFTIVDRSKLDLIQEEKKFQMSGDVSDNDIVKIGALSGANVVITGSVIKSGNSNRLSLKALDVKTGQIITMARESY
jgi:uncharacterized protein (DUF779 family)